MIILLNFSPNYKSEKIIFNVSAVEKGKFSLFQNRTPHFSFLFSSPANIAYTMLQAVNLLDFYLEVTGGAVLIRKTEVEETQIQSTFRLRIPSRFFCAQITLRRC